MNTTQIYARHGNRLFPVPMVVDCPCSTKFEIDDDGMLVAIYSDNADFRFNINADGYLEVEDE